MTTFEPNIKIKKCDIHVLVKLDFWLTRELILSVRYKIYHLSVLHFLTNDYNWLGNM